ncbi:uncharacterized protein Tco025E_09725 [Trypanosoma conorhini]|uniref:Mucin-like glycoprotein n=1 Tax=Trypanosoma conorhini TaxID=83891 RepID=A0A3R7KKV8_9TRYP|nr:uncharacterized protein Tco025E_09725 [Trypanosoma conorhini]RNE96481.1 hypothetical protein Tco025E_09725 [Trypanosoma conorhini]
MRLATANSVGDTCHGAGAVLGECLLGVAVQSLTPQPPDAAVQMRLGGLRAAIGDRVPQGACVTGWPPFFLLGNFSKKGKQAARPHRPRLWLREAHRWEVCRCCAAFMRVWLWSPAAAFLFVPSALPLPLSLFLPPAAPQPTKSAVPLPPLRPMAMTLTVRRRAVCALALLALLCASVCGATAAEAATKVSVEVSCPNTDGKLSWRVAGEKSPTWKECPQAVTGAGSIESAVTVSHALCFVAGSVYLGGFPNVKCPSPPTEGGGAAAFALSCTAAANSALHNLSKGETVAISPTENPLGESGDCELPNFNQPAAEVRSTSQPQ